MTQRLCFITVIPLIVLISLAAVLPVRAANEHRIRVLVGDKPITEFHIKQRTNFALMSSKALNSRLKAKLKSKSTQERWKKYLQEQRPSSKEEVMKLQKRFVGRLRAEAQYGVAKGMRKKVLDELINEHLMINTAKANNIVISSSMVESQIAKIAQRNSKGGSVEQAKKAFYAVLSRQGVGRATFRQKIKATLAWQQLVRKKFGREVNFTDRDVERQLGFNDQTVRAKKVQFNLQQIIIDVGKDKDQAKIVEKLVQANAIRQRFNGCSNMQSLLAPYKNARAVNLGAKTLDQMPSPVDLILSDMRAGQITPPQSTAKGLEMYAVCDRKQVTLDNKKKNKVIAEMRQKAFQLRAKRYLKDLRDEAHIEYRD